MHFINLYYLIYDEPTAPLISYNYNSTYTKLAIELIIITTRLLQITLKLSTLSY